MSSFSRATASRFLYETHHDYFYLAKKMYAFTQLNIVIHAFFITIYFQYKFIVHRSCCLLETSVLNFVLLA